MLFFDRCKRKGHDWQYYGWSVMGFGPYRYHYKCSRCNNVVEGPAPTSEEEDGPKPD